MKKITIDYSGSGIKGLRVVANVTLYLSIALAVLMIVEYFAWIFFEDYLLLALMAPVVLLFGVINFFVLQAFATIAENSLYQKAKLEADIVEQEAESND